MRKRDEAILQEHLCHWLEAKGILYTASMVGVYLPVRYAVMRKRMGVKAGHPDIVIYEPRGKYHALFIELKIGGYPTQEQKEWQSILNEKGYLALIMPPDLVEFNEAFAWCRNKIENYILQGREGY